MLSLPPSVRVFVAREPADMRKQFDGLAGLVIDVIDHDPQSGHLFVFFNKRRNLAKVLWWDRSGYLMLCKRLEHGRFNIFDRAEGTKQRFEVAASELALLLEGIDLRGARRRPSHDDIIRQRKRA